MATLVITPLFTPFLHKIKPGQSIRKEGPWSHMAKMGTPAMERLVFVGVPTPVMLVPDYRAFLSGEMPIYVLAYLGCTLIGFIDDFLITVKENNGGLKPSVEFLTQSVPAVVFYLSYRPIAEATLTPPIACIPLELRIPYFALILFILTCKPNAVNLTDGPDDLCAGISIIATTPFVIFAPLQGNKDLAMLLLTVCGSLLGYLRFSVHPAKAFMGGTDSLVIGGLLTASTMILKQELLLVVIGGISAMELLSVVIRVINCKTARKRAFRMAPPYHHFELGGIKGTQVVLMFWGIGVAPAVPGLRLGVM